MIRQDDFYLPLSIRKLYHFRLIDDGGHASHRPLVILAGHIVPSAVPIEKAQPPVAEFTFGKAGSGWQPFTKGIASIQSGDHL